MEQFQSSQTPPPQAGQQQPDHSEIDSYLNPSLGNGDMFGMSLTDDSPASEFGEADVEYDEKPKSNTQNKPQQKAKESEVVSLDDLGDFTKEELKTTLAQLAELRRGAHKKFEQAASKEKELYQKQQMLQQLAESGRKDPAVARQFLEQLGWDPRAISEYELSRDFEERTLSPEELERQRFQEERQRFEAQRAEFEENNKKQAFTREVEQQKQYFLQEFQKALTESNIPADVYTVARMADMISSNLVGEVPGSEIRHVAQLAFHEVTNHHRRIQSTLDDRGFAEFIGEKGLQRAAKILASRAAKTQASFLNNKTQPKIETGSSSSQPGQYLGMEEYLKLNRRA